MQTVRRWSPVQTQWSRPTAQAANTASSSLTCCCSVVPVPTRHCSVFAPVVTTWRDRWRCAKTAYSSIAPPAVGGWIGSLINMEVVSRSVCGLPHLSLGWRTHWSYLFFPSCCIKLNVSKFHQQWQQRNLSHSNRSSVRALCWYTATYQQAVCLQIQRSRDSKYPPSTWTYYWNCFIFR